MSSRSRKESEHMFSIELKSKEHVKRFAMPNENGVNVIIEGFLGELQGLSFVEGIMLEIEGANGTLKMDLKEEELKRLLQREGLKRRV